MGCFGGGSDREKGAVREEQKWDYITLTDFSSSSWKGKLSYLWLWILSAIAIAVYVADTFTAVNLLAFNKWSSRVDPAISITISKWIFAGCIIFSWTLCFFEWIRAIRVIRRGGVADSYLDPLAATLQSSRVWRGGHGWRRFLVFAELTKSKKGTDYVALFVYFQFKSAVRIILAEGPRQVVNALTLWAAMKADLLPEGDHAATDNHTGIEQFWANVELLAEQNKEQAVILSSMLFTLVIWVFSALCLFTAIVLYILFLWHYVPSTDGTLANYCRRKVDRRLERIVGIKTKLALEKQDKKIREEEEQADRQAASRSQKGQRPVVPRKPTLPQLGSPDNKDDYRFMRSDTSSTMSTLPAYSSQPPSRTNTSTPSSRSAQSQRAPTLPFIDEDNMRPPGPLRSDTGSSARSAASFGSNAPLLGGAGEMGYGGHTQPPVPPLPPLDTRNGFERSLTGGSQQRSHTPQSRGTPGPGYGPPARQNTGFSVGDQQRSFTPMGMPQGRNPPAPAMPMGPNGYGPARGRGTPGPGMAMRSDGYGQPVRQNTGYSMNQDRGPPQSMVPPHVSESRMAAYNNMPPPGPMRTNTGMASMGRNTPGPPLLTNPNFAPYDRRSPTPTTQMQEQAYELQQQNRYADNNNYGNGNGNQASQAFASSAESQQHQGSYMVFNQRQQNATPVAESLGAGSVAPLAESQQNQGSYMAFNQRQQNATPVAESLGAGSVAPLAADEQGGNAPPRRNHMVSPVYNQGYEQNNSSGSMLQQRNVSEPTRAPDRAYADMAPPRRSATDPIDAQGRQRNPMALQRSQTAGREEDWGGEAHGFERR